MVNKTDVSVAPSLVSILVPCCGMIEYTKLCVPSILRFSRPPIDLARTMKAILDGNSNANANQGYI